MSISIEDRIARWREQDPADEWEHHIELLCDAEAEIRSLRRQLTFEWSQGYDTGLADGEAKAAGVGGRKVAR